MGSTELYDWLDNEPRLFHPADVDYVHSPYRIGEMKNVISINGGVELDLMGQKMPSLPAPDSSQSADRWISWRAHSRSEGGKSFICFTHKKKTRQIQHRTVHSGQRTVSAPRTMIRYVATEYGIAKLTGLAAKNDGCHDRHRTQFP